MKTVYKMLLHTPVLRSFYMRWYQKLGVKCRGGRISPDITVIGDYSNIVLKDNAEINTGCLLLAKDRIEIGENSTLAYGTTILTSANPNGPHNKLSKRYPALKAPVIIGDNVWIGANATILPGVTIGDFCVVAAGSIVNKDVPSGVMVAGNPAVVKKIII